MFPLLHKSHFYWLALCRFPFAASCHHRPQGSRCRRFELYIMCFVSWSNIGLVDGPEAFHTVADGELSEPSGQLPRIPPCAWALFKGPANRPANSGSAGIQDRRHKRRGPPFYFTHFSRSSLSKVTWFSCHVDSIHCLRSESEFNMSPTVRRRTHTPRGRLASDSLSANECSLTFCKKRERKNKVTWLVCES